MKEKILYFLPFLFLHLLWIGLLFLFSFAFFKTIEADKQMSEDKNDYIYIECKFIKYEYFTRRKRGSYYKIYVDCFDKPLIIDSIVLKKVNRESLQNIKKNNVLYLYCDKTSRDNFQYEILELKTNGENILLFKDSIEAQHDNTKLAYLVYPILALLSITLEIATIVITISSIKDADDFKKIRNKIKL